MDKLSGLMPGGKSVPHHPGQQNEDDVRKFVAGAAVKAVVRPKKKPAAMAKRFNFSLTQKVSDTIDKLTRWPRTFNASRSDVIRAGVLALQRMDRAEALKLMAEVTGEDPHDPQLVDGE